MAKFLKKRTVFFTGVVLCGFIALGFWGFNLKYQEQKSIDLSQARFSSQSGKTYATAQQVAQRVAEIVYIPGNPVPYVTTIGKSEELKKERKEFYQFAEDGDQLLIYADRAIIFSPKKDRVIAMSAIKVIQPELQKQLENSAAGLNPTASESSQERE